MSGLVSIFFALCWIVISFAVLRYLARRFFHEPLRATVFAASVVVAFMIGMVWPLSNLHIGSKPPEPSTNDVRAAYAGPRDVTAECRSAHLAGAAQNVGHIDGMGEAQNGRNEPKTTGFVADPGSTIWLGGWVADIPNKSPARAACLVVDGKLEPRASAHYGTLRVDVATALQIDALRPTGFTLSLPASDLPRGVHQLTVAAVLASGQAVANPSTWTVRVP